MAFSHVSRPVRAVTDKSFASKFITLGRVIHYWPQAVGPDLALKTYPIGMKVRKAQTSKDKQDSSSSHPSLSSPHPSLSSPRRRGSSKENKDSGKAADTLSPDPRLRGDDSGIRGENSKEHGKNSKERGKDSIEKDKRPKKPVKPNLEAILEIAASSADATLLHYQKKLILERLKTLLGASMIVDIKVTHAGVPTLGGALPPSSPVLSVMQKEEVGRAVENVTDPDLRAALERLGGYIAARK